MGHRDPTCWEGESGLGRREGLVGYARNTQGEALSKGGEGASGCLEEQLSS